MTEGTEVILTTRNDLQLRLKPIVPDDAKYLVYLFEHMGPESRYLRFNQALIDPDPELVWAEARRLAQIDWAKEGAWIAFAHHPNEGEVPVAGVRFIRVDQQTAEASLVVRDDMQNQGIGSELLDFLVEQALAAGVRKIVATIQRSNTPLWHILRNSPFRLEIDSSGGYADVTVHLPHDQKTR